MCILSLFAFAHLAYALTTTTNTIASTTTTTTSSTTSKPDIVYMREPNDRGPSTWQSGIQCLQVIGALYFQENPWLRRTRAKNMIITHLQGMSTPAAQIEQGYLGLTHNAINQKKGSSFLKSYRTEIVSDAGLLAKEKFSSEFIVQTDAYVIVVDSVSRLQTLFRRYLTRLQSWNPGAKFLILFNHMDERRRSDTLAEQIFDLVLNHFYVNTVTLLFGVNTTAYNFYILDNFNPRTCREVKATMVSTCDRGELSSEGVLRRELRRVLRKESLLNCTFYMCAAIAAPFVERDCEHGMELHLMEVVQNKLGFQLNLTCGVYRRGIRVPENDTWTDLLGRVDERVCDFILGGFFSDDEVREDFWVTDSYLFNSHTWFVATAPRRPPWKALFTIFQAHMWLCLAIVLLITWLFWLAFGSLLPELEAHKSTALTAINSWGVTLGASVSERPECQTTRIFFIGLCLYSMNVTSIYTSKLIAVFADPGYEHQISTIEEVIRRDIPFGGPAENRDWFENPDDMEIYTRYNDSDNFMPRTRNLRAVAAGERVILANRMYMLRNRNTGNLYGFPENVFSSPVEIIAKRGFPFLDRFNALIRRMKDSGLFTKIDSDFRYHHTVLVNIREMRAGTQEATIVLTIHHLEGAFAFLIFGVLLSFVAFAGEQINYRYLQPWLCKKKCNWQGETEDEPPPNHHHSHRHRKQPQPQREQRQIQKQRHRKHRHRSPSPEGVKPVVNVRMEQIRFTPLKRRKIKLN